MGAPCISDLSCVCLYAGAGGLDLGFARAGFRAAWSIDFDEYAAATHAAAGLGETVHGDVLEVRPTATRCGLLIGGPPCQGFSVAGKMDPSDPRSRHVFHFLDEVQRLRPAGFVMENVKALAVNARWAGIRDGLLQRARALGYRTRLLLLDASHFEVPQARERMFLVGLRGVDPLAPEPVTAGAPPTVGDALRALPVVGRPGNDMLCRAKITLARKPVLRVSPYAGMLFNGQGRPLDPQRPALTLPASMGGNRTPIIDEPQLRDGARPWVADYHAHLRAGGPPLVGEAPDRLRRITVQEAAALQTFPADWPWKGGQAARYRQIGNAVPPNLAYHVALSVRRALTGC